MDQPTPFTWPAARWTRRRVVAVALGVTLAIGVGVVVAGLVWARSYAPLIPGGASALGENGALIVPAATGSGGVTVTYTKQGVGAHVLRTGFSLRNDGNVAVRIDGLAKSEIVPHSEPLYVSGMTVAGLSLLRRENAFTDRPGDTIPFRPVTIQPGSERFIGIAFRTSCRHEDWSPGGALIRNTVGLRYTYLKVFHRSQDVVMPYGVVMQCFGKIRP